jgi:hypothetical protein
MRMCARALTVLGVFSLSCCASLRGFPEPPRPASVAQQDPQYLIEPEALKRYTNETDQERNKLLRNEMIDERVLEIDSRFQEFEMELWRQGVGLGIGTDWVQLAIAGATATLGGEAVKAALGAASAGLVGAKSSFDKNAFMEKTLPLIMSGMVAEREPVRASIERNKQLPVADYTVFAALSELKKFIRAGTIPGTIQAIAIDAGNKATRADKDIKNIRSARFVQDDAGDAAWAFWVPDGETVDKGNEQLLIQWMKIHGLPTGPGTIVWFLTADKLSDHRVLAANALIRKTN